MRLGYLRHMVRQARRDDRGATAAEYALIAALIAMVIIGAVILLGGNPSILYDDTASSVDEFIS